MNAIDDLSLGELVEVAASMGLPKFRAEQIFSFIAKGAASFDEMTTLSKELRAKLAQSFYVARPVIEQKQVSADGTVKYLMRLHDGNCVETVAMRYKHGLSLCLSTQVGCRQGCKFCASTRGGLVRNLSPGEILGQITAVMRDLSERPSGIVLMGIGEPLDNYDNVLKFVRIAADSAGLGLSPRHISLSTCGLVAEMRQLADEGLPVTLSVSLHAATDDVRRAIMPAARFANITEIIAACDYYFAKTGRRVSIEYIMLRGVNDSLEQARELSRLLRVKVIHVNLIAANYVEGSGYSASDKATITAFMETLTKNGINATKRRSLGADINAACGELRRNQL